MSDLSKATMTSTELKALMEIERYWYQHGSWPAKVQTPNFNITEALQKESFLRGLFNRGITPPDRANNAKLSNEQCAAIFVVVDIHDRRSIPAKLKSMGIKTSTWNGWMQDKHFKEYLHNLSSNNFESALHVAQQGLLSAVEKGDVNAIKYYNQLTGREVSPEVQNARVLVSRLIQVIQTHVQDDHTLMAISRDFERVMRGDQPATVGMIERAM